MAQNLTGARAESAYVLDLIGKKTLSPPEQDKVIEDSVRYWTDYVNPGFLEYRKSVSTDYTAVEWEDHGAVFRDVRGKEFIDMLGGFGIYVTGHRHPKVLKAVQEQLERQAIHSQELIDPLRTYLARLVSLITPGDLQYSFFTNSGTESIEACLKMSMLTTGRHHFIGTIGAFHGKSLGSLAGTSKAMFREPFLPLKRWTHVPFGDVDALRMIVASSDFSGDRVAAVVIEPIQGEGGINVAPPGYLAAAREICDKYGALLVFDEVQCGMGRSGKMFCCEHDGVTPDLMALGKGFGGGVMPIGACVGTPADLGAIHRQPLPPHDHVRREPRLLRRGDRDDQRAARGGPAEAGRREGGVPASPDERSRAEVPEGAGRGAGPRPDARHGVPEPRPRLRRREGPLRPGHPDLGHVHQCPGPASRAAARHWPGGNGSFSGGSRGVARRGLQGAQPLKSSMTPSLPVEESCFWMARRHARRTPEPLQGVDDADVAIVGGGYTGLWTSLFLKELEPRRKVVVLEQELVGYGGSGRNAGIVGETIDHSHELAIAHFGLDEARRLARLGRENLDAMETFLRERGIDAGFERPGQLIVALRPEHLAPSSRGAKPRRAWARRVGGILSREETRSELASPLYEGALLAPRNGVVDPVQLTEGLRFAAVQAGVRIHERTRVDAVGVSRRPRRDLVGRRDPPRAQARPRDERVYASSPPFPRPRAFCRSTTTSS